MIRLLLLAGTAEARALAARLAARREVEVVASLAGGTREPAAYASPTRRGGFGGVEGLRAFLEEGRFDAVVDATHPFALRISANAREAAVASGLPLLRLSRPPWRPAPGDRWTRTADAAAAAAALPPGARAFLAAGPGALPPFAARSDLALVLRAVEAPDPPPPGVALILARPPFSVAEEIGALRAHAITHLVCKNSGGAAGAAKLAAARALALPLVMIERPPEPEGGAVVASVEAALRWIAALSPGGPPESASPRPRAG